MNGWASRSSATNSSKPASLTSTCFARVAEVAMRDDAPDERSQCAELPAIDFHSPGRFAVHNPQAELAEPLPWEPAPFLLGESAELQRFSTPLEIRQHALALLQQATRTVCIYSPDLEPWLYHHGSIQQACARLLLAHPRNQLR